MQVREHMLYKAAKTEKGRERIRSLLEHAIDEFVEMGYEGASINRIIARSGGSKTTVYQSFGNKEGLFIAALEMKADDLYEACVADYKPGRTLLEDLESFGRAYLRGILATRSVAVMRLIYAQAGRLPQVGEWFYNEGILASYRGFAKVLENHVDAQLTELEETASLFLEALRGRLFQQALCLPQKGITEDEIEAEAARAIDLVLALIEKRYAGRMRCAARA